LRRRGAYLVELAIIDFENVIGVRMGGKVQLANGHGRERLDDGTRTLGRARGGGIAFVLGALVATAASEIARLETTAVLGLLCLGREASASSEFASYVWGGRGKGLKC
jgi:hypothetical protein